MCFFYRLSKKATELENRFGAKITNKTDYKSKEKINAFDFGKNLVLANNNSNDFQYFNWGLIPVWAKEEIIRLCFPRLKGLSY